MMTGEDYFYISSNLGPRGFASLGGNVEGPRAGQRGNEKLKAEVSRRAEATNATGQTRQSDFKTVNPRLPLNAQGGKAAGGEGRPTVVSFRGPGEAPTSTHPKFIQGRPRSPR